MLLTAIILLPLAGAFVLMLLPESNESLIRKTAVLTAALTFMGSLVLLSGFHEAAHGMQFVDSALWVSTLNIHYKVGVDGISLWLVVLTAFLGVLAIIFSTGPIKNLKYFLALTLLLETGTLGVFVALDTILFYVFWELMLVPTYFLIGMWGEGRRVYATTKFVLYTLVGSLLMLVAIVWITVVHFNATHELTFDIQTLVHTHIPEDIQMWLFAFFFLAFAIKGSDLSVSQLVATHLCLVPHSSSDSFDRRHVENRRLRIDTILSAFVSGGA